MVLQAIRPQKEHGCPFYQWFDGVAYERMESSHMFSKRKHDSGMVTHLLYALL